MTDTVSRAQRSENMRRIKSTNTKPELRVRKLIHSLGYRYSVRTRISGKPDIVFTKRNKAIFVHGCFWHQHSEAECQNIQRPPKSRTDYWTPKLSRNKARDAIVQLELCSQGWDVLVIWECQTKDRATLVRRISDFLAPAIG